MVMSDGILGRLGHQAMVAAQRLHVRSALNPILWLCAISMPMSLAGAYVFRDVEVVRNWLIAGALTPIAVACLGFAGFAVFKPDKLQSEEYQIRHESLLIIQEKAGQLVLDPASIEGIANPSRPALPAGRGNEL